MTSPIDELLAGALMLDDTTPHDAAPPQPTPHLTPAAADAAVDPLRQAADRDLRVLCEAVVTATPLSCVGDFLTDTLPTPAGALVLGCMLELSNSAHTARFLWQYAAGAGETSAAAAAYCLYLHHLSLGEANEAAWWKQQTPDASLPAGGHDSQPEPEVRSDRGRPLLKLEWPIEPPRVSVSATLRMLNILKATTKSSRRSWPPTVVTVMELTALAVRFVDDDLELPLPLHDFGERIRRLTAPAPETAAHHGLPARPAQSTAWRPGPWQRHPTYRPRGRNNRAYTVEYNLKTCDAC
ncbi:hypothetical protein [Streptomyces sp. NPDC017941]|uniref:hypothetical protein n=1 Tax=unclassified Streptomyces TaxID=2593676 RepID=UPI0037B71700